jgi:hypothetical protein
VACLRDQVHDQQAMPDVQQEHEDLAQADQHIAESEQRLANQIRVIEGMIQNGHNTAFAEECLCHLQQCLVIKLDMGNAVFRLRAGRGHDAGIRYRCSAVSEGLSRE